MTSRGTPASRRAVLPLLLGALAVLLAAWAPSPVQAASTTASFATVADTYVNANRQWVEYGDSTQLRVAGTPAQRTFLRFDVSGLTGEITEAVLHLVVVRPGDFPIDVRLTQGDWDEASTNWQNAPSLGAVVGSAPTVPKDSLDIDVTSAVTGNGTVDLALAVPSSYAASKILARFASREVNSLAATLVVTTNQQDSTPPATPTGLSATAGDGSAQLGWTAVTDPDLAGYRLYRREAGEAWPSVPVDTVPPTGTGYTDVGLTNDTAYEYRLTAFDTSNNESAPSTVVGVTPAGGASDTTPPATPTGLRVLAGDASVTVSWQPNMETDLAEYRLYRRAAGSSWSATPLQTVQAGAVTEIADTGLQNGATYDYKVTAVDTSGNESPGSTVVSATPAPAQDGLPPAAPTGLTVTAGDQVATLTWSPNTEADLQGYRVYRRDGGATWSATPLTVQPGTTYTDIGLLNGSSYDYRVTALDTAGNESQPSSTANARPASSSGPCSATSSYAATVLATPGLAAWWRLGDTTGSDACDALGSSPGTYNGGITLGRPSLVTGDGNPSAGFDGASGYVQVPDDPAVEPTTAMTFEAWLSTDSPTKGQTIVRKHNQYLLRVANGRMIGRIWWSGGGYTHLVSGPVIAGGMPQHLAMTYDGTAVRLFHNGVEVDAANATGTMAGASSVLLLGKSGNTDYLDGRLDEVALYTAALSPAAVNDRFQVGAAIAPSGPDEPTAVGGPGTVGLRWPAVPGATEYRVYRRTGDGSWPSVPAAVTSGATSYVDDGLTDGQRYDYRVTGVVDGTETDPSPVTGATPTSSVLLTAGDIADSTFKSELTARLLDRNPGQVLTLGDTTYTDGTATEYTSYFEPTWGRHLWRTRAVIGNHEYGTANADPYWDYFGDAAGPRGLGYYSYDLGGWHVVVLNSMCAKVGGCGAGSPQEQWLRADLAASDARCTIAAWHHPRWGSSASHPTDASTSPFWEALNDYGVEMVLNGHDHAYERFAPQTAQGVASPTGVRQFTVGTAGRLLFETGPLTANSEVRFDDTFGILRLDLGADSYSWDFLPIDGSTRTDRGSATCH